MGFTIHFYIVFGTNLLTEGPVQIAVFLPILVFRWKGISNGIQTEWNLREDHFWNKRNLVDLEWTSRKPQGGHEVGGRAQGGRRAPHPRGPLVTPLTDFLRLYIYSYTLKTSRSTTKPYFHHHNILYSWDPMLGPFPAICQRGNQSRRASTSTPLPLQWTVSSLPRTFGSIVFS